MKKLSILGSTGSIGTQTLDIVAFHPERFRVEALAAGSNVELLAEQARKFRPRLVSVATKAHAEKLEGNIPEGITVMYGEEGLRAVAAENDASVVVSAMVGSAGCEPTLAAIEAGKAIALANKETLVAAGHIVTARARRRGVPLIPVDSEHSAIFQALNGSRIDDVLALTLTASGGSFRDRTRDELEGVTVADALKHPNWSMGAKVTIDSATMANKGLEVIEARWLFDVDYDRIRVLIHPESIIHSYVEFYDKSVIAQLGAPDMRVPIQYALTHPERPLSPAESLDLAELGKLTFRPMDFERYPMIRLAYEAGRTAGTATAVFNAANEVAVARFLAEEIPFLAIERIVETTLEKHDPVADPDLGAIREADAWARSEAKLCKF
ncbi:1-deoxy-D-xylulose-5-phosphate reductoisomerase [Paenibacillus sp.]|uniref:1-deoxy-D-xylulose-5-phosphate reductoisomerase n=1 Tax=Paenibacillus sp. TaxID=58172 RepID=UPI002D344488|nr:1-deoxy-D-xylulose-5-phosphate reductoisomerase [Paenibacillus sp.]HZG58329.1 1-deoxy-D-xylulose-5-phosphate reductoisomerase [Paenibacillus sp.]